MTLIVHCRPDKVSWARDELKSVIHPLLDEYGIGHVGLLPEGDNIRVTILGGYTPYLDVEKRIVEEMLNTMSHRALDSFIAGVSLSSRWR